MKFLQDLGLVYETLEPVDDFVFLATTVRFRDQHYEYCDIDLRDSTLSFGNGDDAPTVFNFTTELLDPNGY